MTIPVIATGMSGLVGSRVRELLQDKFYFEDLSLTTGIDITDADAVAKAFDLSDAKIVLHMAAKTDVDACEDDKYLGKEGGAWLVNVQGTKNIVSAAAKTGKKVIYISTDFVFDGTKEIYNEKDKPNPVSWYGYTKFLGEDEVSSSGEIFNIIRISYPYRSKFEEKMDFVHRILDNMKKGKRIYGLTDHIFTPTFVDDIAVCLELFLNRDLSGIYHVVGSQALSTIDALKIIKEVYNLSAEIIPVERSEFFKQRAFRPFKLALNNDKIQKLGLTMLPFDRGILKVKKQDSP